MKHVALKAAGFALALLLAKPAYCIDQAEREGAVDALIEHDKAKKLQVGAEAKATLEREGWLKAYAAREVILAEQERKLLAIDKEPAKSAAQELKKRAPAPNAPDAPKLQAALQTTKTALTKATEKLADAAAAEGGQELTVLTAQLKDVEATLLALAEQAKVLQTAKDETRKADEASRKARAKFATATTPARFLSQRLRSARELRCLTAYCFSGDGTKYAIEPVLDLPVGLVWSAGNGALSSYVNSHTVNVEFNAGLRFWLGYDIMSVMVYFSRPLIEGTDPIRVSGSAFEHPTSNVRRPFPSIGIGLAGDVLLLGISYDQLRNGSTDQTRDRAYPANAILSRSLTFSLGFSLFNLSKNAAGMSRSPSPDAEVSK